MSKRLAALFLAIAAAILAACQAVPERAHRCQYGALPRQQERGLRDLPKETTAKNCPPKALERSKTPTGTQRSAVSPRRVSPGPGLPDRHQNNDQELSNNIAHTINVVKNIKKAPAKFPGSPTLTTNPRAAAYSGRSLQAEVLTPDKLVTVSYRKPASTSAARSTIKKACGTSSS